MNHRLLPFSPTPFVLSIEAKPMLVEKGNNLKLIIEYYLMGNLNEICLIDSPLGSLERTNELWKNTCFEWFLKSKKSSKYWEFNASPNGLWNFYSLDQYRSNLKESLLIPEPKFFSKLTDNNNHSLSSYFFSIECSLDNLVNRNLLSNVHYHIAITSVIKWKDNETSYFSLKHPNEKPDFHSPEGFILPLILDF